MRFSLPDLIPLLLLAGAFAPAPAQAKEAALAIREAVAARLELPVADVEVGALGWVEGTPSDRDWRVELPGYGNLTGRVGLTLSAEAEGRPVRHRISPDVQVWRRIPVAAKTTRPGQVVEFRIERVRSDALRGETPVDASRAWEASTTLSVGQPITTSRVHPVPDAREGAAVQILVERGAVRISAPGELMDDAFVGEPVHVTNLSTRGVLTGILTAEGTVLIGGSR
jgi:flagella basal body P-ring formation protein FlgA